ncbi:MAG TPA: bifunctional pyr operon transcriptional regulator/uracil phosphoribosyltransferase PyrR, partial [Terrimicrobiaceae bacterium]|nr:bifunctional pyr operon transcriptional regulator/uracil phosphoribosyltransferase PyrR [Terrimicrobiaceae bacterium]
MTKSQDKLLVMDADAIRKAIRRIAHEVIERNKDLSRLVIAGIPTRGVEVARRIVDHIEAIEGVRPGFGTVDVSMHRDDISTRGRPTAVVPTNLPIEIDGRVIVLVDDVLFTGRSCRAALDAISSFGRPAEIQYA